MAPSGRRGKFPRRHQRQNLHPNKEMIFQPKNSLRLAVAVIVLLATADVYAAQEQPDRPPWAQPGNNGQAQPPTSPPPEKSPEPASPRGTIKVHGNLVNVLVSVLDDHKHPAPDLPVD